MIKATSRTELEACLAELQNAEGQVTARLDKLVASHLEAFQAVNRLDVLRANLSSHVGTTRNISSSMLSEAATTANRISQAVKLLDLEQSRVKETLDVVEQVAELKACVLGVNGSMAAREWDNAAAYLSRASQIPPEITKGSFAEEIVPTAEIPDFPSVTLKRAADSLCGLFLREFQKAAEENDGAKFTRFFKLFPLIGRPDVGLDVYSRHIRQGVSSRARTNRNAGTGGAQNKDGFFYANVLTKLFEHIAQVVEGHGGLVEAHYGAHKMIRIMGGLQQEADVQGGITIDTWSDERNIDRRLTDIKSYAFSFLVQSFLPAQRPSAGTPRAGSPAKREAASRDSEDEGIDMRIVDGILSEAAVMLARWSSYVRFMATKSKGKNDDELVIPDFITDSNLTSKISEKLTTPFDLFSTFFFRRSIEKAFELDEIPVDLTLNLQKPLPSNPPFITSAVDDVMYIVSKVLNRSLATCQRPVVAAVIPTLARVLGSDFVGMIQRKMRDETFPRASVQGMLPPEDKVVTFLVLINSLDIAIDYVKRIVRSRTDPSASNDTSDPSPPLSESFPFATDVTFVTNTLLGLEQSFLQKATELANDGLQVAFGQCIKPRLRPLLADSFRDVDYQLSSNDVAELSRLRDEESGGAAVPDEDLVRMRFAHGWEAVMQPFKRLLTERNYERLLGSTLVYLASKVLEKRIWAYQDRLNELGAVRLERDVAGIASAAVRGERYALKEAFAKCAQIGLVMNMETEEWEELTREGAAEESGIVWRLDVDERARARSMIRPAVD
ncbi:MAG: hypothetical protein M1814_002280 [Vezdaea aestivalis]|nr:MAG: hypothetical protein M1814_002280 [Vezdaea aestivalis]